MLNPYTPPETASSVRQPTQPVDPPSKPIIPAVIGLFTYGSSSPYALVLCVEQYLRPHTQPLPRSTHLAAVLSACGSLAWIALNLVCAPDAIDGLTGRQLSMYSQMGLMIWFASLAFLIWMTWRVIRFKRQSAAD